MPASIRPERAALQDALRAAIAARRGYCWWTVNHAGWVVTLEEGLAWCLVWLMASELGIGPFLV
jgi:hypothetical protein